MPEYPLHRRVEEPPYTRYACTVIPDEGAEGGFRIGKVAEAVADADFVYGIREALKKPVLAMAGRATKQMAVDSVTTLFPGDEGFLAAAVRQIPGTYLGSAR